MLELSMRFTSDEKDQTSPIQVSFFRPDQGTSTSPQPFVPPLNDETLAEIRWYLEIFSIWPTGPDFERAERIYNQFETWGRRLRDSVLPDQHAARLWQQFVDAPSKDKSITIDATDPRVLRLPWEILADDSGHLFSQKISIRRRLGQTTMPTVSRDFTLPVRILVVVARPNDAGQIDARAVSLPLLDAVEPLGTKVAIEFLYPPTLSALSDRLADEKAPTVDVVHFDGHGVYDAGQGLGYLLFENDRRKGMPVDANTLGNLLNQCGVPLMVLNACQSAAQNEANPYASVAARLIRAGVGSVLAMNYSVLAIAAQKFVGAFYGALADGKTIGQAVDDGRRKLMADPKRHSLTRPDANGDLIEASIELRDWFLPALYQLNANPIVFADAPNGTASGATFTDRVLPRALTDSKSAGGLPEPPTFGFQGRAHDLLTLERKLATYAIVVLHGYGGMGKTALATEAGRWFHRIGRFIGGATFVSFENGGSLQQLCSWMGQAISDDPNFAIGEGDPVQRIAQLLREKPALIILDNFESVLGDEPLMPPDELDAILDAVWLWGQVGMKTAASKTNTWGSRILITSRVTDFSAKEGTTNVSDPRYQPSKVCAHMRLDGLDKSDALELATHILDDLEIDRAKIDRRNLEALMDHLGGQPLSLYLVLPHLAGNTPARLIRDFEQLLPGFTSGAAKGRNESLTVSLDFSLRRLGPETHAALPTLGIFQGGAFEDYLLEITQIDPALWQTARRELQAAALLTVQSVTDVQSQFLRFHPTLLPTLGRWLTAERRAELETRYW